MKNIKIHLNTLLKSGTIGIAFTSFSAYLMGLIYSSSYNSIFNLGDGIFKKSTQEYLAYGIINFLKTIGDFLIYKKFFIIFLLIIIFISILSLIKSKKDLSKKYNKNSELKRTKYKWIEKVLKNNLYYIFFPTLTIVLLLFLYINIIFLNPIKTGKTFAKNDLNKYKQQIKSGKNQLDSISFKKEDGKFEKIYGKTVNISKNFVAIFDGKKVIIIPIKNIITVISNID